MCSCGALRGKPKPIERIAVIELENRVGVKEDEIHYLTEVLRGAASQLPKTRYSVMTKDNILVMLPPEVSLEDCQGTCAVDTGRKLGAHYILVGSVVRFGKSLRVTLNLHHTRSGQLLRVERVKGLTVDQLEQALESAALRLFSELDPKFISKIPPNKDLYAESDTSLADKMKGQSSPNNNLYSETRSNKSKLQLNQRVKIQSQQKKINRKSQERVRAKLSNAASSQGQKDRIANYAAAQARFLEAELLLKKYLKYKVISRPESSLAKTLKKKLELLQKCEKAYLEVLPFQAEQVSSGAFYRLAEIYSNFANVLTRLEPPRELQNNPEALDMYKIFILEKAQPYIQKAVKATRESLKFTHNNQVHNKWTNKAAALLSKLCSSWAWECKGKQHIQVTP